MPTRTVITRQDQYLVFRVYSKGDIVFETDREDRADEYAREHNVKITKEWFDSGPPRTKYEETTDIEDVPNSSEEEEEEEYVPSSEEEEEDDYYDDSEEAEEAEDADEYDDAEEEDADEYDDSEEDAEEEDAEEDE